RRRHHARGAREVCSVPAQVREPEGARRVALQGCKEPVPDEPPQKQVRSGTVRVRLHRARLFVRKELMKTRKPRLGGKVEPVTSRATASQNSRPPRCKAMFAELSNYLDKQLDDSLCDELEKHLDGCGPCQVFLASLEATINDCRRL